MNEVLKQPETVARFRALSMEPVGGDPAEIRAFIKAETERWGGVIKAAGVVPE